MADQTYVIPEQPEYSAEIRKLQDSDPASASQTFNPLFERLIENTAAIKTQAEDSITELKETVEKLEEETGSLEEEKGQPGGVATLDEDGKIPMEQLPDMHYDAEGAAEAVKSELAGRINEVDETASTALSKAIAAQTSADTADSKAAAAQTTANEAKTIAEAAQSTASGKASAQSFSVTLTTAWTGSGPYTQTVAVPGITAAMNPVVGPVLSDTASTAQNQLEAWGCVGRIVTGDGSITATCYDDKPETEISIQLRVVM